MTRMLTIAIEAPEGQETMKLLADLADQGFACTVQPNPLAGVLDLESRARLLGIGTNDREEPQPKRKPIKRGKSKTKRRFKGVRKPREGTVEGSIMNMLDGQTTVNRDMVTQSSIHTKYKIDKALARLKMKGVIDYDSHNVWRA